MTNEQRRRLAAIDRLSEQIGGIRDVMGGSDPEVGEFFRTAGAQYAAPALRAMGLNRPQLPPVDVPGIMRRQRSDTYKRLHDPGIRRGVPAAVEEAPIGPNARQQQLIAALAANNANPGRRMGETRTAEKIAASRQKRGEARDAQRISNMKLAAARGVLSPGARSQGIQEGILPDEPMRRAQMLAMLMQARQPQRYNPQEQAMAEFIRSRIGQPGINPDGTPTGAPNPGTRGGFDSTAAQGVAGGGQVVHGRDGSILWINPATGIPIDITPPKPKPFFGRNITQGVATK